MSDNDNDAPLAGSDNDAPPAGLDNDAPPAGFDNDAPPAGSVDNMDVDETYPTDNWKWDKREEPAFDNDNGDLASFVTNYKPKHLRVPPNALDLEDVSSFPRTIRLSLKERDPVDVPHNIAPYIFLLLAYTDFCEQFQIVESGKEKSTSLEHRLKNHSTFGYLYFLWESVLEELEEMQTEENREAAARGEFLLHSLHPFLSRLAHGFTHDKYGRSQFKTYWKNNRRFFKVDAYEPNIDLHRMYFIIHRLDVF